jgi:hypothetical protein
VPSSDTYSNFLKQKREEEEFKKEGMVKEKGRKVVL